MAGAGGARSALRPEVAWETAVSIGGCGAERGVTTTRRRDVASHESSSRDASGNRITS
jgi:hypothetical protein